MMAGNLQNVDFRSRSNILSAFSAIGYRIDYRLLDAADYGTPQHRERVFLVGHKLPNSFRFPRPIFGPDSVDQRPHVAPREAFKGLRVRNSEANSLKFEGGKYSHLLPEVPPGQNYLFFTSKRGHPAPKFAYRSRFSDFLYKAHPDYPMKTIIASPGKYTGPLHWDNRYFSIAEYKAIQGFPVDYKFFGDRSTVVKQIGNSVSPLIAEQIALAIQEQITKNAIIRLNYLELDEKLSFDKRKGVKAAGTRKAHQIISERGVPAKIIFSNKKTSSMCVRPQKPDGASEANVNVSYSKGTHNLDIRFGDSSNVTAKVRIGFWSTPRVLTGKPESILDAQLYGYDPFSVQLLWNAVDEWVQRFTTFQSLFELYGHFTEPYPYFRVIDFQTLHDCPIFNFAQ